MSVGEWLNNIIEPDDEHEDDDAPALFTDFYAKPEDEAPRNQLPVERERRRNRAEPRRTQSDRDFERTEPRHEPRDRDLDRAEPRHELRDRDLDRVEPRHELRDRDLDRVEPRREPRDRDFDRDTAKARNDLNEVNSRLDRLSQQIERIAHREVRARSEAPARPAPQPRRPPPPAEADRNPRLTGAPARNRPSSPPPSSIDDAVAEIAARQRILDGDESEPDITLVPAAPAQTSVPTPAPVPAPAPTPVPPPAPEPTAAPEYEQVLDLGDLDKQLRHITERIESLRPSSDLEIFGCRHSHRPHRDREPDHRSPAAARGGLTRD